MVAASQPQPGSSEALAGFSAAARTWFLASFGGATRVQREGWPVIHRGDHTLLCAPTGSGKTLAAFLACIDRLLQLPVDAPETVRTLYVSPLKALVFDVERNLRGPLAGVRNAMVSERDSVRQVRVAVRTGDTSARERRLQLLQAADILVTTPESLALLLTSRARETLRSVDTVIIDEIHTMAASKRGVHLALSLERLAAITGREPQRVGLSATQNPLSVVARYLGGDRPVSIVDASEKPRISLRVEMPASSSGESLRPEGTDARPRRKRGPLLAGGGSPLPARGTAEGNGSDRGTWPAVIARTLELIRTHRSTIVFTNSRLLCERLAQKLNELAGARPGEELVLAHHGSISHTRRHEIEELLKTGRLPALVATSSLELGIDMGAVDLVVLIESPGASSRGLQRVGRAGHAVGELSVGHLFPKFRGDLLECSVVARQMQQGEVEALKPPRACLDVLAQHVVAMTALESWRVEDLLRVVRRAAPFADLSGELFTSVLDMLAGRFPSEAFQDLAPRISWDRNTDVITGRRGAAALALLNSGTIPDRGLYGVHLVGEGPNGGPRIGELDEEMVYESRAGETIVLGASTWKIEQILRDRVLVTPAPAESGRLPFWRGDRSGRPIELGRALGAWLRAQKGRPPNDIARELEEEGVLDGDAARTLAAYLDEQQRATGTLPTDQSITVESFRDELGDWRICLLTPFGGRVHAPWSLALEARLSLRQGWQVPILWSDDGIAIRLPESEEPPDSSVLFPDPEELEDLVVGQLRHSALFAARFRENAARALLLPRRSLKGRTPLWLQRQRAQNLLAEAHQHPRFPVVLETYRECLQDVFDLPALTELLSSVRQRATRVEAVQTSRASPFAQGLVFQYVATYLYDTDAPAAERKAQALSLDRDLLRQLLGHEDIRELLDPEALLELERDLQRLDEDRRARDKDQLHDLLRRLGDLSLEELRLRAGSDVEVWLAALESEKRACRVRVAGEERVISTEDAARFRDALGTPLPQGLPRALLDPAQAPLEGLLRRYARTHGPFGLHEVARRLGLLAAHLEPVARQLVEQGVLVEGALRPGRTGSDLCDAEVLRRLKRRTLAKLRAEVAPVDNETYARFLLSWHGVSSRASGLQRLEEVVAQLEGQALPFSALESEFLPARMAGFAPALLDQLGAVGGVVWVGRGALGAHDGKVALHRRAHAARLLEAPPDIDAMPDLDERHRAIVRHLEARGACFVLELQRAAQLERTEELMEVLWDLVWRGLVTNDTFQPLRGLGRRTSGRGPGRGTSTVGGRWSLVRDLLGAPLPSTERAHALARGLLERWGVVSREMALFDEVPGGFASVYPVLRALEESGQVRRGHFVEGLTGAQFALPGAVDRLRARRETAPDEVTILSAADPACPWGAVLPWPAHGQESARPRRVAGAAVVLVGGRPVLALEKGGKSLVTFPALHSDSDDLSRAVHALRQRLDYKTLRISRIDGTSAELSAQAPPLLGAGFSREGSVLVLGRGPTARRPDREHV